MAKASEVHFSGLAIIPARGGSKGIPRKNLQPVAGKPLLAHTIEAALSARCVQRTVVSTDDAEIAEVARACGAEVVMRPADISSDTASSESALLHVLDHLKSSEGYEPDLVVFLQCTSPIRRPGDIDNAVGALLHDNADSLLSVSPTHRFLWRRPELVEGRQQGDSAQAVNYDFRRRPRRQEREPEYVENGSIYVFKPWVLRELDNRLGGKVTLYQMDYWSSFEIDSLEDLALCDWVLRRRLREEVAGRLPQDVRLVVLDFDGVFTDSRVLTFQDGSEAVLCSRRDGLGLAALRRAGIQVVVLSKEQNPVVQARCRKLQLECRQGLDDKKSALAGILAERDIPPGQAVFVGDDVNDLEAMRLAGCAVAPADAHPAVLAEADIVLESKGGRGAIRELCDLLVERQQKR